MGQTVGTGTAVKPQPSITVSWQKCGADKHWCSLENVDLANVKTIGVYIIWHEGNPGYIVRVGQGNIKDRLCAHRNDEEVLAYKERGTLRVTWASVPSAQLDGVERYLANKWPPLIGDAFPDADPIAVNSPWS